MREKEDRNVGGTERQKCVRKDTGVGERKTGVREKERDRYGWEREKE